ncbi:MAG: hypothetical protein F4072_04465, partial [Acidimicrobiaceae bacterium]|nr:hypothetical protein [Acidimicrobiaceae bacterium]
MGAVVTVSPTSAESLDTGTPARPPPGSVGYGFKRALLANGLSVIAEVKRRSPSAGNLNADADAVELA